jgi:hypothetical protein
MAGKDQQLKVWHATEAQQDDIDYLKEMLTSSPNVVGLSAALVVAAGLSIPFGVGVAAIPVVGAIAAEAIMALFIPSSPVFRAHIDRRKKQRRREEARQHLAEEISARAPADHAHWRTYERMTQRLESLKQLARSRDTSLNAFQVERLDDATVDYLGMWMAWIAMRERWENVDERKLRTRLAEIDDQLERTRDVLDRRHLDRAKEDLARILDRRQSLWGRAAAVEAAMLSMADTFEEVYQRVVANPASADITRELDEAVERMRVEEELDLAVDAELEELFTRRKAKAATKAL